MLGKCIIGGFYGTADNIPSFGNIETVRTTGSTGTSVFM